MKQIFRFLSQEAPPASPNQAGEGRQAAREQVNETFAAALGLTLAIQGPVSNYGAVLTLILTRLFKVDDTLTVVDRTGIVPEIKLALTVLKTEDNEVISIPNRKFGGFPNFEKAFNRYPFPSKGSSHPGRPAGPEFEKLRLRKIT